MKKLSKTCDAALWHQYREARNLVTSTIRRRKKNYLSKEIINNRFNKRQMWRSLNKILPTKKNEGNSITEIGANSFNKFFAEIGEKLTEQFNSTSKYP